MKKILVLLGIVIALTGCQSVKEENLAVEEFFKAIGSGDVSFLKKYKKKQVGYDDKSWEEIDKTMEGKL